MAQAGGGCGGARRGGSARSRVAAGLGAVSRAPAGVWLQGRDVWAPERACGGRGGERQAGGWGIVRKLGTQSRSSTLGLVAPRGQAQSRVLTAPLTCAGPDFHGPAPDSRGPARRGWSAGGGARGGGGGGGRDRPASGEGARWISNSELCRSPQRLRGWGGRRGRVWIRKLDGGGCSYSWREGTRPCPWQRPGSMPACPARPVPGPAPLPVLPRLSSQGKV